MKFTVYKGDIINQLSNLQRITSKTQPNIIIKSEDDFIILSSTNGSIILEYKIEARNVLGEPISINAKEMYSIFDRLQDKIEFNNGEIKCGKIKLKIRVEENIKLEPTSLPFNEGKIINLNNFKEVIKKRIFACRKDDVNTILRNICINGDEACATDGNVLSLGKFEQEIGNFLISQEIVNEILKCFDGDEIEISEQGNKVLYQSKNVKLIGFKVTGEYPKYKQIIPHYTSKGVELISKDILKNLEIFKLIVDEHKKIKFSLKENKLLLSAITLNNSGDIEQDVEYKDKEFEAYFNVEYFIDVIKNCNAEKVTMKFDNPDSPCTFEANDDYMILMPMLSR